MLSTIADLVMTTLIVIPARMASTRLPGKPLADINGRPMIVHVLERALEAALGRVVVAAGDQDIADAVQAHGGEAVLTRPDHPSGSDRIWEAVQLIDPDKSADIILNLQGDLPTLDGDLARAALTPLKDPAIDIATLATEIVDPDEVNDPAVVKAIVSLTPGARTGRALYFTRATAPTGPGPLYHHIGLYAYRRDCLERFVNLPLSPLEQRERLEQLRALEAGMTIGVDIVDTVPLGVDTPEDLEKARALLQRHGGVDDHVQERTAG